MTALLMIGDVRERLAELPDGSVDLIATSPPFLALRSYLPSDHADKGKEIGTERTPADYLDVLLDLTASFARVLAPHGSIAIELGDTYAGSGGAGGDYGEGGLRDGQPTFKANTTRYTYGQKDGGRVGTEMSDLQVRNSGGRGWPLDKSLCGIPTLFTWSLAYGRNLLRSEHTFDPWRIRNLVVWGRPNLPVGALGDKVRPATSYITIACKARDRWFDLDAVRTPHSEPGAIKHKVKNHSGANPGTGWASDNEFIKQNPNGAPPLDWWDDWYEDDELPGLLTLPTEGFAGAHFATWPRKLAARLIDSMCPREVCRECGVPRRRIVESERLHNGQPVRDRGGIGRNMVGSTPTHDAADVVGMNGQNTWTEYTTLGWTDCGHGDFRPGLVCDPFAGSGTTLAVAAGMGRDSIGIELDRRNVDLAMDRVGPLLLTVDYGRTEATA